MSGLNQTDPNDRGTQSAIANFEAAISGNNTAQTPLEQTPFAVDRGGAAAALQAQQQASRDAYVKWQYDIYGANGPIRQAWAASQPAPHIISDDNIKSQQQADDRGRLIQQAAQQYEPIAQQLAGQAFGPTDTGVPSAAMSTLAAATQHNQSSGFGMGAGGLGTGGQHAALMRAAIGNAADAGQQGANQGATLHAQEQQAAAANQLNTRNLLSQVLGAKSTIYSGLVNNDASTIGQDLNAKVAQDTGEDLRNTANAANTGATIRGGLGAGGTLLSNIAEDDKKAGGS